MNLRETVRQIVLPALHDVAGLLDDNALAVTQGGDGGKQDEQRKNERGSSFFHGKNPPFKAGLRRFAPPDFQLDVDGRKTPVNDKKYIMFCACLQADESYIVTQNTKKHHQGR